MVSAERERAKGTRGGKDPDRTLRRHSFRGGGGGVHFGGNVFGRVRMKMRACWAVRAARLCVRVCLCVRARDAHSLPRSLFPIFCSRLSSHWRSFSIFVLLSSPFFSPSTLAPFFGNVVVVVAAAAAASLADVALPFLAMWWRTSPPLSFVAASSSLPSLRRPGLFRVSSSHRCCHSSRLSRVTGWCGVKKKKEGEGEENEASGGPSPKRRLLG